MKIRIRFTDQPFGFDPEDNCYIRALRKRYEVELSEEPELVFYSCFGTDYLSYPGAVRIFLANEPVVPNFNDCDYAIGSLDLSFGDRYFRQPPLLNYGEYPYWERAEELSSVPDNAFERKFCNFIYANAVHGSGARLRVRFCQELSRYKPVDCPGAVLNNMQGELSLRYPSGKVRRESDLNAGWAESKLAFLRNYKFTIAFENSAFPGFSTEKLIHPLMARSVPIYWGDPLVAERFNPKAFINCADYGDDLEAVVRRVKELDEDREQYMEMLRQPILSEGFPFRWEESLEQYLSAIIEGGCRPVEKNPMGFSAVSAQDFSILCREGKVGMQEILRRSAKSIVGWLHYKLHK